MVNPKVLEIIEKIRKNIGEYCMCNCKSLCCKSGYLPIKNDEELRFIVGDERYKNREKDSFIEKTKYNGYLLKLTPENPCPKFKNNKCSIYNSKNRPKICREYPISFTKTQVIISPTCPAFENNVMKKELEELKKLGMKII